jgi:regulation of enolase protein 1 (concanavalin A-like superfamily)
VAGGALPEGWNPGPAGGGTYSDAANGTFVISGTGTGVGGNADNCSFAYRTVTGDFTITARLIDRHGPMNMVGLMMRETPEGNSRSLALTLGEVGGRQCRFRTRTETGGDTTMQLGNDYTWQPVWFRLQRQGNVFTALQSSDGIEWFPVGKSTVDMPQTYLAGFAVSTGSATGGNDSHAAFDNVSLEVKLQPVPETPTKLAAIASEDGTVHLAWRNTEARPSGIKVEASIDNAPFYEIADLAPGSAAFVNTGVRNPASYRYRIRAYNTGGYSGYSNIAAVKLKR